MEPLGVHIGIAAWIDRSRAYDGFAVAPPLPVPFTPKALLPLIESADEHRQAELARMANFLPRKGGVAEPFGPGAPLWTIVAALIDRMKFARRALTNLETDALEAARKVLYVDGGVSGLQPSPAFNAYLEMRSVVQALQVAGAPTEVQSQALADWLVLGFKNQVEHALAEVVRLGARSSVMDALSCRMQLDETMLLSAGDLSYAPTSFHPLSSADTATWTVAEVSLAELSSCGTHVFPTAVPTLGSTSATVCQFAYATIDTLRPWPFSALLERDDWQLAGGESVSTGDGVTGTIPAYVQTLYAASVLGISATTPPPPRLQVESFRLPSPPSPAWLARAPSGALPRGRLALSETVPARRPTEAAPARDEGAVMGSPGPEPRETPRFGGLARIPLDPALLRRFQAPLGRSEWLRRLATAREAGAVVGTAGPEPSPPEPAPVDIASGAAVVGFGCSTVPPAPRPNPQYQW
jgi:hypothetical protein